MKKLRVTFLITGLGRGGAEVMLVNLLRQMDRSRFDPAVISLMDRGRLGEAIEELGVPLHTLNLAQGRATLTAPVRLLRLVRATHPDVLQGWMYHANLAAQWVALFHRVPTCWCIQNSFHSFAAEKPMTRLVIRAQAMLSRRTSRIVYVSHVSRGQHESLGFCHERGVVIPNGVDPDRFVPSQEARLSLRAELGLAPETILIGLMGRHHPQKDHPTFLRAAASLGAQYPDAHFVLAGTGVDAANPQLGSLIRELRLDARVHLLGERSDMPRINAALDLATSSSSYGEALSLALAEAMACAVPCVVTDIGDSGALVGETGIVIPPRDPEALAQAWTKILGSGDSRRRELGAAARARVTEHYANAQITRRYEELHLAAGGHATAPTPADAVEPLPLASRF